MPNEIPPSYKHKIEKCDPQDKRNSLAKWVSGGLKPRTDNLLVMVNSDRFISIPFSDFVFIFAGMYFQENLRKYRTACVLEWQPSPL